MELGIPLYTSKSFSSPKVAVIMKVLASDYPKTPIV